MKTHYGADLELSHVSRFDSGVYLCLANNGVPPTVSKRVRLYVDCKKIIVQFAKMPYRKNILVTFSSAKYLGAASEGRLRLGFVRRARMPFRSTPGFPQLLEQRWQRLRRANVRTSSVQAGGTQSGSTLNAWAAKATKAA